MPKEKEIGVVFHYFDNIGVAAVKLSSSLKIKDHVHIKGATTDFEDIINDIQVHNVAIEEASAGDEIGIRVTGKARKGDKVFLVK